MFKFMALTDSQVILFFLLICRNICLDPQDFSIINMIMVLTCNKPHTVFIEEFSCHQNKFP